jgi:hypothetical protein
MPAPMAAVGKGSAQLLRGGFNITHWRRCRAADHVAAPGEPELFVDAVSTFFGPTI